MKFGEEFLHDPRIGLIQKTFVRLFGIPILGMRIRARVIIPIINKLLLDSNCRILDAGCGRGMFTFYMAKKFRKCTVTGIDLDQTQLEINKKISKKLNYRNCEFVNRDIKSLDNQIQWDFILTTDLLEHLENDQNQCRLFYNSMSSGAKILIHVPHITRNLFGFRMQNFMGIEGHVRPGYTMEDICNMLNAAGFVIEKAFYNYGYFETLSNSISYLITGGREKRKLLYALCFPLLLILSLPDRFGRVRQGSGIVVLAVKNESKN